MIMRVSCQCIYIPSYALSSIPYHAVILGKNRRSVVSRIRSSGYLFRIRRSAININSTLQLLSFKQNSKYVFPSQVRRSLRTLTTSRSLRYSCFLMQRLKLCPHNSLGTLKVFNSSNNIPVLGTTSLPRGLCAFKVHGYVICTWL